MIARLSLLVLGTATLVRVKSLATLDLDGTKVYGNGTGIGMGREPRATLDVNGWAYLSGGMQLQITGFPGTKGLQMSGSDTDDSFIGTMGDTDFLVRRASVEKLRVGAAGTEVHNGLKVSNGLTVTNGESSGAIVELKTTGNQGLEMTYDSATSRIRLSSIQQGQTIDLWADGIKMSTGGSDTVVITKTEFAVNVPLAVMPSGGTEATGFAVEKIGGMLLHTLTWGATGTAHKEFRVYPVHYDTPTYTYWMMSDVHFSYFVTNGGPYHCHLKGAYSAHTGYSSNWHEYQDTCATLGTGSTQGKLTAEAVHATAAQTNEWGWSMVGTTGSGPAYLKLVKSAGASGSAGTGTIMIWSHVRLTFA